MSRFLRQLFAIIFAFSIGILDAQAQDLPVPEIVPLPESVCHPSGMLIGTITNIPEGANVIVNINNGDDNYFIGPDKFKYSSVSVPEDTITIYFIDGEDTAFKSYTFDVVTDEITIVTDTICTSATPYIWHGSNIYYSGTYYYYPEGSGSCSEVQQLNIEVIPSSTTTTTLNVCEDDFPFTWNGITVTAPGIGVATYTSTIIGGCDSITSLNVIKRNNKTKTVSETVCFDDLPYVWNGITVSVGGVGAATYYGTTSYGCDSVVTLNLNVAHNISVHLYDTICSSELPYIWLGLPLYFSGSGYTFLTNSVAGCDSLTTLHLTVFETMYETIRDTICNSEIPYLWNGITVTSGGDSIAAYNTLSIYGCDSIVFLNLAVGEPISLIQNISICQNQLPYNWNGITISTGGSSIATYTTTNILGCDSTTTLNLTVNPVYQDTNTVSLCSGALPYVWNGITVTSFGSSTAIYVGVTTKGCDSIIVLNLIEIPTAQVYDTVIICANEFPYHIGSEVFSFPGSYEYVVTGAGSCDTLHMLALQSIPLYSTEEEKIICLDELPIVWNGITVDTIGVHVASIIIPNIGTGCDSILWLNVLSVDPPSAPILALSVAELGVVNVEDDVTYQWEMYNESTETWEEISGATGPNYTALVSGKYRVAAHYEDCNPIFSTAIDVEIVPNSVHQLDMDKNIQIYPNPASQLLHIKTENVTQKMNATVVDIHGRVLYQNIKVQNGQTLIDVSAIPIGTYLINITNAETGNLLTTQKIVINR